MNNFNEEILKDLPNCCYFKMVGCLFTSTEDIIVRADFYPRGTINPLSVTVPGKYFGLSIREVTIHIALAIPTPDIYRKMTTFECTVATDDDIIPDLFAKNTIYLTFHNETKDWNFSTNVIVDKLQESHLTDPRLVD